MWTVHVKTDQRGLTDDGAAETGTALESMNLVKEARVEARPTTTLTMVLDREFADSAVGEALHACEVAMEAVGGTMERLVSVACTHGSRIDWRPGALITHKGLAARFNVTEAWVRKLMTEGACPVAPVDIEGEGRAAIYPTLEALAYLAERLRRSPRLD
ncbi:hypothetical protein [Streptomyces sp. cg35]|uniref:hypothetical protein n=1 Tax=Streptomyces sp. cg35 TaxID=3421650 RepID=UPI003D164F79